MTDNAFPDTDPAWSPPLPGWPDGLIAFESARTGDSDRNIYVMDSGGGAIVNVTPPRELRRCAVPGPRRLALVEPGRQDRLHAHVPSERRRAAGGLDRGRRRLRTVPAVDGPDPSASEPAWSPDGQHVAYVGTTGTDRNIARDDGRRDGAAQIDTTTSHDIAPDWQEDSVDPQTTITAGPSGAVSPRRRPWRSPPTSPDPTSSAASTGSPSPRARPRGPGRSWPSARTAYAFGRWTRSVAPTRRRRPSTWSVQATAAATPCADPARLPCPPDAVPTPVPPTPPVTTAWVASTVRLDQTRGRVPARVSVSPAGSQLEVTVVARVSGQWVRVGRADSEVEQRGNRQGEGARQAPWRQSLDGERVKAKLVVVVTSPTGATVRHRREVLVAGLRRRCGAAGTVGGPASVRSGARSARAARPSARRRPGRPRGPPRG